MNRQEIIEGLRDIHAVALDERQLYINGMRMARFNALINGAAELLALRDEITIHPDYNFDTAGRYSRCPTCRALVRRSSYCWNCGQAFRWEA